MIRYLGSPKWQPATLEDLVFFQRGFDITKAEQIEGEVPVISSSGIKSYHSKSKVPGPGVVIGRKGTLGSVFYSDCDYWPHDTTLWSKDFKGNNPKFTFYALKLIRFERFDAGSANPTLNRNHIHNLPITIPELDVQNKIATILEKYDDLIENNKRRIELLEDSARQLYKEWFVRFRFPGHEHVKIIDGVPDGWSRKPLKALLTLNYGKALKAEDRIPGNFPVYGSSGVVGTHTKPLVKGPGIIVGRKGNVGSIFWSHLDFFPIDTVYFVSADESNYFVYYALLHTAFISTDVAVPGLNRDFAYSREVIVPTDALVSEFEEEVSPVFKQCDVLSRYNEQLAQARDLLLPKLMSGEIAV